MGNGEREDITDDIGTDRAYVHTYTNPEKGGANYLIVGGDKDSFGYAEFFDAGDNRWCSHGVNSRLYYADIDEEDTIEENVMKQFKPWLVSALKGLGILPCGAGGDGQRKDYSYLFKG